MVSALIAKSFSTVSPNWKARLQSYHLVYLITSANRISFADAVGPPASGFHDHKTSDKHGKVKYKWH
jgi:hypothetical protein